MRCKVLSASLGYKGKIYMQGEYIELESEKEVEKLISFRCVIRDPIVEAKEIEVKAEAPKVEPESAPEGKIGNHSGGRKRK